MLDEHLIFSISARTGLGRKFISKEDRISLLLKIISEWEEWDIALKGGTAINRLYLGEKGRFSEDIDIDVFGPQRSKEKLEQIKGMMESISDFNIQGPRMMHLTARFDAYYTNEFGEKDRVRLDLYLANDRPWSVRPVERKIITSSIIQTNPSLVPVYSFEDLLAHKIVALGSRMEGKDLYDIHFSLERGIDRGLLKRALELRLSLRKYEHGVDDFIEDVIMRRDLFRRNWLQVMNNTNHFIPRSRRPEWRSFIDTTFDRLQTYIHPLE